MARRVFLHVGTPKSGTTYLQDLWWRHVSVLTTRGLLLPGRRRDHLLAARSVCGSDDGRDVADESGLTTWGRLLREIEGWRSDALVSHELFAPATSDQAAVALEGLQRVADEVHLMVTARDLVRQLPSDWQQNVKQGRSMTLRDFWDFVRHDPRRGWWRFQDVPDLLDRWGQGIPPDRTHLVVLPPSGTREPAWLWTQVCLLLGVDHRGLDAAPDAANVSLGPAQVELVRRVQAAIPVDEHGGDMRRLTKSLLSRAVHAGPDEHRLTLPADIHAWARERGARMAQELASRDLHVVGDLADLVAPAPLATGRTPEDVTDEEVAAVAVSALAHLLQRERRRRGRAAAPPRRDRRRTG